MRPIDEHGRPARCQSEIRDARGQLSGLHPADPERCQPPPQPCCWHHHRLGVFSNNGPRFLICIGNS
eukprot:10854707-Lingulodinium_polyedra.AAC.1